MNSGQNVETAAAWGRDGHGTWREQELARFVKARFAVDVIEVLSLPSV
jgi:hypothetical protein